MTQEQELFWLIGILEGEACFTLPTKYDPCRIQLQMKDKDIVKKVAKYWNRAVCKIDPPSWQDKNWAIGWKTTLGGRDALALMEKIYPYMSQRRQQRISEILRYGRGVLKNVK